MTPDGVDRVRPVVTPVGDRRDRKRRPFPDPKEPVAPPKEGEETPPPSPSSEREDDEESSVDILVRALLPTRQMLLRTGAPPAAH